MRVNVFLITLFAQFFPVTLPFLINSFDASIAPNKRLASRSMTVNCGPRQSRILQSLLVDIAHWSGLCFNVLRDGNPTPEQVVLTYRIFGFEHLRQSPRRDEVWRRFEVLRWEAEHSPSGRAHGSGYLNLECSTCEHELSRTGYDLFAINREWREFERRVDHILIVSISIPYRLLHYAYFPGKYAGGI